MKVGVYPGTFDPVTWGHLDIIQRAGRLVDHLIISVASNLKKQPLFTLNERAHLIQQSIDLLEENFSWSVQPFSGLLVDHARHHKANVMIRGLRAVSDFDYEFQITNANYCLAGELETIFLMARDKYHFVSSSLVKEIATFGGDVRK
ncbi:MAG TPA: pantetheine-phosphate adenylyltransferase, partial [Candidatus Nitrosotenuis sp.]|nr:pantetheine-phosphate adenylyltransferase [Candidatus Nitrosotenuis sp.]